MGKMDTINHLKIDPTVLPAAHYAASRKKSRKPRIFRILLLELLLFAGAGELYSGQAPESKQKYFKAESVRFVHHLNS